MANFSQFLALIEIPAILRFSHSSILPSPFPVPHIFRGTVKNWKWYCLVIGATSDRVTLLFLSRGGFLISPKWKNFRSQKLQFAEKTRLNNAIWRCWHIQCEYKKYVFQKINRIECLTMWSLWMWIRMLVFFRQRGWLSSHHPFTVVLSCDWMHLSTSRLLGFQLHCPCWCC